MSELLANHASAADDKDARHVRSPIKLLPQAFPGSCPSAGNPDNAFPQKIEMADLFHLHHAGSETGIPAA